jgi:hypothetical protein
MAVNSISTAFVEEFESGVHMAYQRQGSKLRGTVRTRNGVKNKTTFQKVGKGTASQKARNAKVPAMNVSHSVVAVTLADWFAGEWIDDLDMLRTNHDEMLVAQQSGAYALGRKTDEMIITAGETSTNTVDETSNGVTLAWAFACLEAMGNNDVPDDGERYAAMAWENWTQLMDLTEFGSADYVGATDLPFAQGTQAKRWLGFLWFPHSGMTTSGANKIDLLYHSSSIGHAIGADVQTSMQYHNDYDSFFALNKMQMEAVLIDLNGCIKATVKA